MSNTGPTIKMERFLTAPCHLSALDDTQTEHILRHVFVQEDFLWKGIPKTKYITWALISKDPRKLIHKAPMSPGDSREKGLLGASGILEFPRMITRGHRDP